MIPAPRRSPISWRRARLRSSSDRPRSKSPAGAGQVAEGVEREGLALLVAELLEAGEALLDQLFRVGEIALDAIHRGEVDEDVGGGRGAAHAAGDERGVLVQEERIADLGLDRDHPVAERPERRARLGAQSAGMLQRGFQLLPCGAVFAP